jgi:hypothetical protein
MQSELVGWAAIPLGLAIGMQVNDSLRTIYPILDGYCLGAISGKLIGIQITGLTRSDGCHGASTASNPVLLPRNLEYNDTVASLRA